MEHVSRIARVLRQDGGHLLCAGVGGSGRQSLARLAGFISGMEVFQVEVSVRRRPAHRQGGFTSRWSLLGVA